MLPRISFKGLIILESAENVNDYDTLYRKSVIEKHRRSLQNMYA